MIARKILVLLIAVMFTLGVVSLGFAAEADVKGTVTKIDGNKITVKDDKGKATTVEVKGTGGAKVGDKVAIKAGTVTKAGKPAAGGY